MTREARTSAVIMGFDTHMILGAVPVLLTDTLHRPRKHQPDIAPPCRDPATPPPLYTAHRRRSGLSGGEHERAAGSTAALIALRSALPPGHHQPLQIEELSAI
jgi:hypothetical protein